MNGDGPFFAGFNNIKKRKEKKWQVWDCLKERMKKKQGDGEYTCVCVVWGVRGTCVCVCGLGGEGHVCVCVWFGG